MSLPTTPQSRAGMPPRRARVLLGASAKVGKTTLLANWAPQTTLIVDTHNGTTFLDGEHYVQHVSDWPGFVGTVDDVLRGGHPFHTLGLDLLGDLWRFCDLYYGRAKDGLKIPASGCDDYGRSSAKARSAFTGQVGRLLTAPVGVWFLTHLREKTDKEGQLIVYAPDMDKNVHAYVMGAVDFVWLAETLPNGRRVVHTQPTEQFEAGSRVPLPSPMPMDARQIATAMDRALNPAAYGEDGKRRQPEPAPALIPPTVVDEGAQAPPEARDVKRTGESDVPSEDVWWTHEIHPLLEQVSPTSQQLRGIIEQARGEHLPERVASWKAAICKLDERGRATFKEWLVAEASVGTPLEQGEGDPEAITA